MRDGADYLTIVEYDTKRMTTCPVRAVEQLSSRNCTGLELDARVPFPEDLPTAQHGNNHNGEDAHISTIHDKGARCARA